MIASPSRPCAAPWCPNLQPCQVHPVTRTHNQNAQRGGSGWAWQRIRRRILERDGYRCCYCGGAAEQVDHVRELADRGDSTDANLIAVCRPCHQTKTNAARKARG